MKRLSIKTLLLVWLALALQSFAVAEVHVGVTFSSSEIDIISRWYSDHGETLSNGQGRKKSKRLPPGIAKNMGRGKPLPPGIAKQVLPSGLVGLLPPAPRGYERIIVDGKVLLVEVATRVVHDILTDIILR